MKDTIIDGQYRIPKPKFDLLRQIERQFSCRLLHIRDTKPKTHEAITGNLQILSPSIDKLDLNIVSLNLKFGKRRQPFPKFLTIINEPSIGRLASPAKPENDDPRIRDLDFTAVDEGVVGQEPGGDFLVPG